MSINITVHGSPVKRYKKNTVILDPEGNKKRLLEERRKLRLEQVRQKSKELASQVRKKVENERQKQIKLIEDKKKEELKNWRCELKEQLNDSILDIGAAHKAAKRDEPQPKICQLSRDSSVDLIPAIINTKSVKCKKSVKQECSFDNKENFSNMNQYHLPKVVEEGTIECSAFSNSINKSPKNVRKTTTKNVKSNYSKIIPMQKKYEEIAFDSKYSQNEVKHPLFSTTNKPFDSYASFKERQVKQTSQSFKKTPSLIMSLGSSDTSLNSSSSSLEIQDIHNETNQHFTRIFSKDKVQPALNHKLNVTSEIVEPTVKSGRTKFTQISDFLNKNQKTPNTHIESDHIYGEDVEKNILTKDMKRHEKMNSHLNRITSLNLQGAKKSLPEQPTIQSSSNTMVTSNTNISSNCKSIKENQSDSRSTKNNVHKSANGQNNSVIVNKNQEYPKKMDTCLNSCHLQKNMEDSETLPSKAGLTNATSYDYNNRFKKTINPSRLTTVTIENPNLETNATENANIERQLQKSRENELETIRKKTEERSQKALERERIRRDYEMLEAKLEALTKDKQLSKSYSNINENISEVRLKLLENEKVNKINSSIENVIKRPVTITLPETHKSKPSTSYMPGNDLITGINLANIDKDSGTLNSSDSCCSILLNYVENQSKQINEDIQNSDNDQKTRKLKELLNRLENLKTNLLKELEKCKKSTANKNIQTMFDSITGLRQEREEIILLNTEKKDLKKRENELKKREAILEMKLREFYEMKKAKNDQKNIDQPVKLNQISKNTKPQEDSIKLQYISSESSIESSSKSMKIQDESSECIEKKVVKVDNPIEIVIKVKEAKQKTPCKIPRKKSSLIHKDKPVLKKHNVQKISTPIKIVDDTEYTTSTVYKSPPETMRTELGELIDKNQISEQAKPTKPSSPDKAFEKCKDILIKEIKRKRKQPDQFSKIKSGGLLQNKNTVEKNVSKQTTKQEHSGIKQISTASKKPYNSSLVQYIQRLLGMSRHSIQMLGVSSSDIQTPSSSIINTSNNISNINSDNDQEDRLKRIQSFIEENYSFVNEIEESLKKGEKSTGESEESARLIEEIWKKSLKTQPKRNKLKNFENPKPILKKIVGKQKNNEVKEKNSEEKSNELSSEERVLEKYTEMTDNCTQRIAELNEMIERVRKEKQKILEITLSSNGGGNSETEYLEFVHKSKPKKESERLDKLKNDQTKIQSSSQQPDNKKILDHIPIISSIPGTPIKETVDSVEMVQLEKNKLTGVSRDSGISLSRPLTAQDYRESPDVNEKLGENSFEPLLKDIPKPNQFSLNKPTLINFASVSVTKQISVDPNYSELQQTTKKNKPPASISRYSPQLIEDVPHELSTILEIDTPATSRLNVTLKDTVLPTLPETTVEEDQQQKKQEISPIPSDTFDTFNIDFQKYPNFEEYAKAQNMDIELFDAEKSAYIKKLYEELFELTQNVNINLKKFPSISSFQNLENSGNATKTDQDSLLNVSKEINLKKFLTPKEYFIKIGATDFLDSKSLIDNSQSKSSTSKLVDMNGSDKEFSKEWCLKTYPTLKEYVEDNETLKPEEAAHDKFENKSINKESKSSKFSNISKTDSNESLPDIMAELKRRNIIHHSIFNKTSTAGGSSSSKENKDPKIIIKPKNTNDISGVEPISSSHTSSEIRKELEEMGLEWASLMLKKQRQSKALSSSTSSSFSFQKQEKEGSIQRFLKNTTIESHIGKDDEKKFKRENDTINTTLNEKFGKPLNLREFLTQELQKRTRSNTDSTSLTDDSLASLFLRSLLGSATPSPRNGNDIVAGGSSDRQQKTSTPVLLGLSSSSKKSTSLDSNCFKLFSGESRISSVRFNSESSSSNDENIGLELKPKHSDDLKNK